MLSINIERKDFNGIIEELEEKLTGYVNEDGEEINIKELVKIFLDYFDITVKGE